MARGRIIRGDIGNSRVTEYRPSLPDGDVSKSHKILMDDIYQLRNIPKIVEEKQDKLDLAVSTNVDNIFNPGGSPKFGVDPTYIIGIHIFPMGSGVQGAGTATVGTNNNVVATVFFLPFDITITTVVWEVTSQVAGSQVGIGWYDFEENLIWETGPQSAALNGVKRTSISPIFLPAATYIHTWTAFQSGGTIPGVRALTFNNVVFTGVFNSGTGRAGFAGNSGSSGNLPSTLGGITTPLTGGDQIYTLFELS